MYVYLHPKWPQIQWDEVLLKTHSLAIQKEVLEIELFSKNTEVFKNTQNELRFLDFSANMALQGENKFNNHAPLSLKTKRYQSVFYQLFYNSKAFFKGHLTEAYLSDVYEQFFDNTSSIYRKDKDALQMSSCDFGRERVIYQAPNSQDLREQFSLFFKHLSQIKSNHYVLSAIAHWWLKLLYPYASENDWMARVAGDFYLRKEIFMGIAPALQINQKDYQKQLEISRKSGLDLTGWLLWYLEQIQVLIQKIKEQFHKEKIKHDFKSHHSSKNLNSRQKKVLKLLLHDFKGHLTTKKWAKITKTSLENAAQDLESLNTQKILKLNKSGEWKLCLD